MERVNRIWQHPLYQSHYHNLQTAEADRIFCRHGLDHLLDVARLMYIRKLEEGAELSKEIIYAAALLHDIGRYLQISEEVPHHEAGVFLSVEILSDCGFSEDEADTIAEAVMEHRNGSESELGRYLYDADKKSRCCFACPAAGECNWPEEKKNLEVRA